MGITVNSDTMKKINRNEVLRLIRKKPCSRVSLAKKMKLTRSALSVICEELLKEKLIIEGEKEVSGGRPAVTLKINPDYGVFGGIHFTRNSYTVGICDFAGNTIDETHGKIIATNPEQSLKNMYNDLKSLVKTRALVSVGISAPGPLSRADGTLGKVANFSKWSNLNIAEYFSSKLKVKCILDNFSNALAYAEYPINPACKTDYLELIIDSGFGSCVARTNGGIQLSECELGHTTVDMNGEKCDCGNVGCAELYVNENKYNGSSLEKEKFYTALASVLINAYNTFGVNKVVFNGAVLDNFDKFAENLNNVLAKRGQTFTLLPSMLKHKETFVACSLAIFDNE